MKKKMITFEETCKMDYYKFCRGVYNHRRGIFLWLDKISSDYKNELLDKYSNVKFLVSKCQYAPEIKNPVIFIADVSFTAKFENLRPRKDIVFCAKIYNGTKLYHVSGSDFYFCTKKEAEKYIRTKWSGDEMKIRLNDLKCA